MADIVISIASKVAELLVVPIGKHICYPFKYKSNMDELKKQVAKLTNAREMVQHSVEEAKTQGDEVEKFVEQWLNNVDEFTKGVVKPIIDDEGKAGKLCSVAFCPNLMMRYSLSKKAAKTAKDGVDLLGDGTFQKISYRPLLQKTTSIYTRGYDDFDSRKPIFNNLMEALKEADVNFIGVYGMGGVGKTTLVKRVVGQAIEDKLFDVVVMAEVTETPEIKNIQGKIADDLGLKFHEESLTGRAARLRDRLKKEKRVLVVLDNIWAKLDLEAVGIPLGGEVKRSALQEEDRKGRNDEQRQCKILLTSRSEVVLSNEMDVERNFLVEMLSNEEAGNLFWRIVGDSTKNCDFDSIGAETVGYCAGLPVAIATVAGALKKKSLFDWKDALDQLRRSNPRRIKGMDANVYSAIKLSYDFLESEEAKSLFLLCSLYNASSNISINYLLRYGMGLCLFQNVSTLEQGRNRLHTLINNLKASSLLLDGNSDESVQMHDIIHAVAVSIASTDKFMFNVQDDTDVKDTLEEKLSKDSIAISLPYKDVSVLPERLEYPKLKLLLLFMDEFSLGIPDTLFEGIKELKVLDMTKIHMSSLPESLSKLTNLQTLCLDQCQLKNVAITGELKKLEILCFWGSDIEQLPRQIGQLTQLRLLDLSNCSELKVISAGVISSLMKLEELYMGNSFVQWQVEGKTNASLSELKQLSRLTTLEIHVLDAQVMPHDLLIFEKLERYRIFIGDVWDWFGKYETPRTLKLKLNNSIYLGNGVKGLLNRTEDLYLDELKGVKNVLYQLNGEGFQQLKHLHVQNGPELQYIVNSIERGLCNVFPKLESLFLHNLINLEQICHGGLITKSFSKLRKIKVGKCDRLRHLFSFCMAKNLLQLQKIEVIGCKNLEEIIFVESEEQAHQNESIRRIEFTQLRTLTLQCLPRLTDFGFNAFRPNIGSQEILAEDEYGVSTSFFSQNVVLPSLQNLKLSSINIGCTWLDQLPVISSCCQALTNLTLEECNGLKFLFSYSMVKSLVVLEMLEIRNCKSIEGIINTEELRGEGKVVFPKLIKLQLKGLPNLIKFGSRISVEFSSMTQLSIEDCPKLKTFSFSSAHTSGDIKQGEQVEEINWQDDIHPLFNQKVVLPTLTSLNLSSIPIPTIWHNQLQSMSSYFQNLKEIIIDGCDTLKYVFSSSMAKSLIHLEGLEISNCKFIEVVISIAGEIISNTLFPKLYKLHLKPLPELTIFCNFAGNSIEWPSLAQLWIENCPKMHTFVSNSPPIDMPASKEDQMNSEENLHSHIQPLFDEKVRLPNLKYLDISKMDSVRRILHHQHDPNSFWKLDDIVVMDCYNLLNIFPSNMLGKLQKLDRLVVSNCQSLEMIFEEPKISSGMVEKYVAEEDVEAVPRLVFPQLTFLKLADLPRLRIFYRRLYISEWPMLKTLRMWRCGKVERLTSEFQSLQEIHGDTSHENSIQQPLFLVDKVAFPNLEVLSLEWNCIVKEMLNGKFSWYSCKIKNLQLINARKETAICPCFLLYTLPNLERLNVTNGVLGEMFMCEELGCKEKYGEAPIKLNNLILGGLNDSLNLWEENSLLCKLFQVLTTLEVKSCGKLQTLASSFTSFQNLTTLEVSECNGLLNLMAVSVAKSLVQLTRLKITECKMIEEIILHMEDIEEDRIIFNKLKYLELHCLPMLTSFCFGNYAIEFPSLQQVVVRQCPNMENFSQGALSTPRLHKLQTEEAEERFWEGSLNTTIKTLFKDMVGLRDIENFRVSDFPHLVEVWHKQILISYFSNLKSLVVDDNCFSLRYMFTPSVALGLMQLQELEIKNCAILEAIIFTEEETIRTTLFSNLNKLKLLNLPEFKSFCDFAENAIELPSLAILWIEDCPNMQNFISNFTSADRLTSKDIQPLFDEKVRLPNLKFLTICKMDSLRKILHHQHDPDSFWKLYGVSVLDCHSLLNVFPSNMLGKLQHLDILEVSNCKSMEMIFEEPKISSGMVEKNVAEEDVEAVPRLVFPQLTFMKLADLPRLRIFYPGLYISEWPMLKTLIMWGCEKVETLTSEFRLQETHGETQHENSIQRPLFLVDKDAFPNLEELSLEWNCIVKEILNGKFSWYSCKIKDLRLNDASKETAICPCFLLYTLPNLEQLGVYNGVLEEMFMCEGLGCEEKYGEAPIKLNSLILSGLNDSLNLWEENSLLCKLFQILTTLEVTSCRKLQTLVSSFTSFQNLTTLEVSKCNGLLNLMAVSAAKNLVQLTRLKITECKMIEEIILHGEDLEEDLIIFNKLKYLELHCLPMLTSFYFGNYAIEFPSLQQVVVRQCPNMEYFSQGALSTPRLHKLQTGEAEEGFWEGSLNTTIKQLFKDMNRQSSEED
ncbi:hypothetical protein ACOSP7_029930 [Xanthoceras sorbifolium]